MYKKNTSHNSEKAIKYNNHVNNNQNNLYESINAIEPANIENIQEKKINNKKTYIYLNLLKIIACFLVIVNHTNSRIFINYAQTSLTWHASLTYFFISRIAVPIFIMTSGALLLNRIDSYKKTYLKVIKFILILMLTSYIYYLYNSTYIINNKLSLSEFFKLFIQCRICEPLWFLYLYLGLLMMLPFLQRLASTLKKSDLEVYLLISIIYTSIFPIISHYMPGFKISPYFTMTIFNTYLGILMLGYYIHKYVDTKKYLLIFSIVAFLISNFAAIYLTILEYQLDREDYLFFAEITLFPIIISSASIFYIFKYLSNILNLPTYMGNIINFLSGYTFIIYLVATYFITETEMIFINLSNLMHPIFAVFIQQITIFSASLLVALFFKCIPILKKLL